MGASQSEPQPSGGSVTGAISDAVASAASTLVGLPVYGGYKLAQVSKAVLYPPPFTYQKNQPFPHDVDPEYGGMSSFITGPLDDFGDWLAVWYALLNTFKKSPYWCDRTEFTKTDFLVRWHPPHPDAGRTYLFQYQKEKGIIRVKLWDMDGDEMTCGVWVVHRNPVRVQLAMQQKGARHVGGDKCAEHLREGLRTIIKNMGRHTVVPEADIAARRSSPAYPMRNIESHPCALTLKPVSEYIGDSWDRLWHEWIVFEITSGKLASEPCTGVVVRPDVSSPSNSGEKCCLSDPLCSFIDYDEFTSEVLGAIRNPSQHVAKLKSLEVEDVSDKEFVVNTEWDMATPTTPTTKTQQRAFFDREAGEMRIELSHPKSTMCYRFHHNPFRVEAWGEVGGERKSGQIACKVVQETIDTVIRKVMREKKGMVFNVGGDTAELCKAEALKDYSEGLVAKSEVAPTLLEDRQEPDDPGLLSWFTTEAPRAAASGARVVNVVKVKMDKGRCEICTETLPTGSTGPGAKMYARLHKSMHIECWAQEPQFARPLPEYEEMFFTVVHYIVDKLVTAKQHLVMHNT